MAYEEDDITCGGCSGTGDCQNCGGEVDVDECEECDGTGDCMECSGTGEYDDE